ncbi:MAG: hypothetical protein J6S67_12225 [Methanobrevibacter sp.]|nr:hypothetical protein [Methanobrevibacter sp.]
MNGNYTIPKFPPRLIIPTSFEECLTYGQRQYYMWKVIEQMQDKIDELEERIEALEGED